MRQKTLCVFCGKPVAKSARSKEHVIPMWMLRATGDPNRNIRIEFDPESGADVIRPASTFHFPACETCNKSYGKNLETLAKKAFETLSRGGSLSVSQCYRLLDWLDKVRIGLWLGYNMLHKEVFDAHFHIDSRLGKKDRIAIVSVDPEDDYKGFSVGGCDNNIFRTSQAGVYLRINNVRILSLSFECFISRFAGMPYVDEFFVPAGDLSKLLGNIKWGDYELKQDWKEFAVPGATTIAQSVFWPGNVPADSAADIFFNRTVLSRMKNAVRISKREHLNRFFQTQLISNAGGAFRYYPKKTERIRFGTAQENNDAFFMRDLYALFWKHVMPLNPRRVVDESGKKYGVIILGLLWIEKVLQIVFRLRGLGIGDDAITLDLINELHLLTRLREESVAHLQGTCVSGDDVLFS
jgi:hypothetical protein